MKQIQMICDTTRKKNDYFEDEIKLFEKIKSGDIKLEKDKKNSNTCLNQILTKC